MCTRVVDEIKGRTTAKQSCSLGQGPRTDATSFSHEVRLITERLTRTTTRLRTTMPSITDHIDRLTTTMKSVKASASTITQHNPSSPFTKSVLSTPLGDLIRDIDPSELGLFTLVPPLRQQPRINTQSGAPPEITRVEVVSATPLRKHSSATRRDVLVQRKEPEPEVFAEAALKYIDR